MGSQVASCEMAVAAHLSKPVNWGRWDRHSSEQQICRACERKFQCTVWGVTDHGRVALRGCSFPALDRFSFCQTPGPCIPRRRIRRLILSDLAAVPSTRAPSSLSMAKKYTTSCADAGSQHPGTRCHRFLISNGCPHIRWVQVSDMTFGSPSRASTRTKRSKSAALVVISPLLPLPIGRLYG